jgi:serine/threonine-protein phosphatase 2B regulatory subunit
MGHNSSLPKVDAFSPEEVQRLEKRFQKLDLDRSGSISVGEFVSVPELKENPLIKRVVDIFDADLSGEVDFKGIFNYLPRRHDLVSLKSMTTF